MQIKKQNCFVGDIPEKLLKDVNHLCIDTEAMGLMIERDRLCTIQLMINKDQTYIVHFPEIKYESPNLVKLLSDKSIVKLFHFARFDVGIIYKYLGVLMENIQCTRILSKIVRTYSNKHGLKELCRELLKKDINKGEQSSYWGNDSLTDSQISYAVNDVIFLPQVFDILMEIAKKENRYHIAEDVFAIMPRVIRVEMNKFNPIDLIEH